MTTHCPELDEVLQHGGSDEEAVEQRVRQEQDEELVIGETHAVVHPVEGKKGGNYGAKKQTSAARLASDTRERLSLTTGSDDPSSTRT